MLKLKHWFLRKDFADFSAGQLAALQGLPPSHPSATPLPASCVSPSGVGWSTEQYHHLSWPDDFTPAHRGPYAKKLELVVADP